MKMKDLLRKVELTLTHKEAELLFGILLDWDEFVESERKSAEEIEVFKALHESLDTYMNT